MPCDTLVFSYPFVGIAQRALISSFSTCAIFMVSHVSLAIIKLIEGQAVKRKTRYIIVYSKLTGNQMLPRVHHGLLIHANHHEKYYFIDGCVFASGSANLTDTEFNDQTLNRLVLRICGSIDDLMTDAEFRAFIHELKIILRGVGTSVYNAALKLLANTPCQRIL